MLNKKSFLMKLSSSVFMVIAISFASCAQQQDKTEQVAEKSHSQIVTGQKIRIPVEGMSCSACQANVKNTIKSMDGVSAVEVSLENKMAYVTYDTLKVKPAQIQEAINKKGYKAGKPEKDK